MHILLIHQAFASLDEAGGTRHYELSQDLIARGHRVTVIASQVSYLTARSKQKTRKWIIKEEPIPGLTILRVRTYSAIHRSFLHRLIGFFTFMFSSFLAAIELHDVEVVWGTTPPIFQAWTAWLVAWLKRAVFLLEVRDLWPAFAVAVGVLKSNLLITLSERLERFLYRHASRVIVNSPGFIEHVQARGARKVDLVINGADPEMFNPAGGGRAWRDSHALGTGFVAMYAGAHGMSNDLQVVVEAAALLQDDTEIMVVLVGDGKEKPSLQARAEQLNLQNIRFIPSIPKQEMAQALAACDAAIAILKPIEMYKTTYPNKVFDYMAAGRPVILAIDGVIRQVVETAGAGIYVPPGSAAAMASAIRILKSDPDLCQKMGAAGRYAVETQYHRAFQAEQLSAILGEYRKSND